MFKVLSLLVLLASCAVSTKLGNLQVDGGAHHHGDHHSHQEEQGARESKSLLTNEVEDVNSNYNFQYKVADEEEQVYQSHSQDMQDQVVTGEYSWVDPEGTLHLVRYRADETGYHIIDNITKRNFVKIVPKVRAPPKKILRRVRLHRPSGKLQLRPVNFTGSQIRRVKINRAQVPAVVPAPFPVRVAAPAPIRLAPAPIRLAPVSAPVVKIAPLPAPVVKLAPAPAETAAPIVTPAPAPVVRVAPAPAPLPIRLAPAPVVRVAPAPARTPIRLAPTPFVNVAAAPILRVAPTPFSRLQNSVRVAVSPLPIVDQQPLSGLSVPGPRPTVAAEPAVKQSEAEKTRRLFGNSGVTVVKFNSPTHKYEYKKI